MNDELNDEPNDEHDTRDPHSLLGSLATGVPVIDEEHAYLIALEGRLAAALRVHDDALARGVFHDLLEYMSGHFTHEETLMGCLAPDAARRHKEEHANISGRLVEIIGRRGAPSRVDFDPDELAAIVATWLEHHIRYWDMPLAKVIQLNAGTRGA